MENVDPKNLYRKTENPVDIWKINKKTKEKLPKSFETPKIFACGGLNKNTTKKSVFLVKKRYQWQKLFPPEGRKFFWDHFPIYG